MIQTTDFIIKVLVKALQQKVVSKLVISLVIPIIVLGLSLDGCRGGFQVPSKQVGLENCIDHASGLVRIRQILMLFHARMHKHFVHMILQNR